MKPASSPEAFEADPWGTYIAGRCWLIFAAPSQRFSGLVLWGQPDETDAARAHAVMQHRAQFAPHPSLVDTRDLEHVDPFAFDGFAKYFGSSRDLLEATVTRGAVLCRGGLVGAIAAGFTTALALVLPVRAFREPGDALAWLECADDAAVFAEVEQIVAETRMRGPLLGQLNALLEANMTMRVAEAAELLAVSPRTLQRKLLEAGTTFQNQLDHARARIARRLLSESDASVSRVAFAVGMSPQALSELFRRIGGEPPDRYRRARRATPLTA